MARWSEASCGEERLRAGRLLNQRPGPLGVRAGQGRKRAGGSSEEECRWGKAAPLSPATRGLPAATSSWVESGRCGLPLSPETRGRGRGRPGGSSGGQCRRTGPRPSLSPAASRGGPAGSRAERRSLCPATRGRGRAGPSGDHALLRLRGHGEGAAAGSG